jgi:two-component system, NarL family, sensor histidine kinase UhpB
MSKHKESYNLLVVEDNKGDFILLRELLKRSALPVGVLQHSFSLSEVPTLLKEFNFDIAILDLSLPDSSGLDSVTTLSRLLPHTPIVVLSGLSTVEIAVEAIAMGVQDYLIKGEFDEKLLAKTVQYSIERKRFLRNMQESKERFEFVNKATQDTIWEWDYRTGKGVWGEGLIKTYGYTEKDLVYDELWITRFVHPDDRQRVIDSINKHVTTKQQNWDAEFRFIDANGTYREVYDRGYILFEDNGGLHKMIGAMTDLTEKKALEQEIVEQQLLQQRLITETTLQAQEKERNELGKELHDNINQILATVKMYLGMSKTRSDMAMDLIEKSYKYVSDAMEEIRKLSHSLVAPSLGDMGLITALKELAETANLMDLGKVNLQLDEHYIDGITDKNIQLILYRIVQEQIININKYAEATKVEIGFNPHEKGLLLTVTDNGKGFDTAKKATGIGLRNIKSRAEFYGGNMSIISAPGKGCSLKVFIPLPNSLAV